MQRLTVASYASSLGLKGTSAAEALFGRTAAAVSAAGSMVVRLWSLGIANAQLSPGEIDIFDSQHQVESRFV